PAVRPTEAWCPYLLVGFNGDLSPMPDRYNPDDLFDAPVEESVGRNHEFAKGEVRKIWKRPPGLWESREPPKAFLGGLTELARRVGIVAPNILECAEELP